MSSSHMLGKYRLIAELGHGGMADVFLAMVEGPAGSGFAKLAVVKRLRANLVDDPEFVTMLIDEARITARLNHPNVVQMQEVGVEGDEYFLAMEYLDGQPLHRIDRRAMRAGKPITRDAMIAILMDVLSGLHHAHDLVDYDGTPLNIVHRDITPHNIFITYDGQVKVMDFGIAKAAGRAHETQHGVVKGKVRYMSPEQAMGRELDRRADLFAVGVLLWHAATGQKLWGDRDDFAIVQALIAGEYQASPKAVCPTVPDELDRICRKALARNPENRYSTAAEMRADLEAFLGPNAMREKRALVQQTGEMFAKERRDLRVIVENVTKGSQLGASPATLLARSGNGASSTSIPAMVHSMRPSATTRVTLNPPASAQAQRAQAAPAGRTFERVAVAALAAAACVALAFAAISTSIEPPRRVASVPTSEVTPLAASPARGRVRVQSRVETITVPVYVRTPAPAPAPTVTAPPPAAEPADKPNGVTIPSIHPTKPARGGRLNVDTADPWNDGAK